MRRIALAAGVPRFSTHTLRHLCLTDLARAGWELHAIATFAGHRDPATTMQYIHLSGRELAGKLARGMAQIHDWRVAMLAGARAGWPRMTTSATLIDVSGFDRSPALSPDEREALASLGWQLRRRRGYDPTLSQWGLIGRLLAPLDAAHVFMHRPDTALHRRSALDAAGLVLSRCAEEDAAYWGWPEEAWVRLIGQDRHAFARPWPDWVDQTARPYVAAYGYLLCGFDALHRLGSFNRLALAWRVFGREAMDHAQERIAAKLEGWGYRSARTDLFIRTFTRAAAPDQSQRTARGSDR